MAPKLYCVWGEGGGSEHVVETVAEGLKGEWLGKASNVASISHGNLTSIYEALM